MLARYLMAAWNVWRLKIARIVLFVFFSDIKLILSDSKFIFSSLSLAAIIGLKTFWKSEGETFWHNQSHRGVPVVYFFSSRRMLLAKVSFQWILAKSFTQQIWNFIHNLKLYMPVLWQLVHWFLCPLQIFNYISTFCFSDFLFTTYYYCFLTNLQNILNFDLLATKTEDH